MLVAHVRMPFRSLVCISHFFFLILFFLAAPDLSCSIWEIVP